MVRSNSKVIIVDGSRKRAVAIIFPGTRSRIIVGDNDEVQVIRHHVRKIFRAEVSDTLQIAPRRVGMEVADNGEMRKIIQKLVDPSRGAIVAFNTAMSSLCRLVRNGVFHHITIAAVAVAEKNAVALLLVDLNGRYEQSPEGVGRNMNI